MGGWNEAACTGSGDYVDQSGYSCAIPPGAPLPQGCAAQNGGICYVRFDCEYTESYGCQTNGGPTGGSCGYTECENW